MTPLKGNYVFLINAISIDSEIELTDSKLIIGGKAFGVMGTDELRRDLAIGLLMGNSTCIIHWVSSSNCFCNHGVAVWSLCRFQR